jgi:lysine biosynthesis protein LysW
MSKAKCPMCGAEVKVATSAKLGAIVICGECDTELEVVSLKPLELDWPLDEMDDDEDYDDFELQDEDDLDDFEDFESLEDDEELEAFDEEDEDDDDEDEDY